MEAPQDVVISLRNIKPTFNLRYNRQGKVASERSFDVNGNPREVQYDPRWELWDTDESGVEYKVTTLQDGDGGYRPPDQRLVELIRLVDPARYDGSPEKMLQALVDEPNDYVSGLDHACFDDLVEYLTDAYFSAMTPKVATIKPIVGVRPAV